MQRRQCLQRRRDLQRDRRLPARHAAELQRQQRVYDRRLQPGDGVLVPNPTYPIHSYSVVIADGDLRSVPLTPDGDFFARLQETARLAWPKAKMLILSFPHNPTTMCVDRDFFVKVVDFAREHRLMVVHDFAYADFTFDGYHSPSFLEVPGALVRSLYLIRKERVSLVYSSSPPNSGQVLALLVKRLAGRPWVADFRDEWTEGIRRKVAYKRSPLRGRIEAAL